MAEVKNTFLQAKMNLDFDDRILPNGQYREAYNIITGRSEDSDVGALENISGNVILDGTNLRVSLNNPNIDCIGYLVDSNKNRIIVFLTDCDEALGVYAPPNSFCAVYMYNIDTTPTYAPLVTGSFLNFSKKSPIYGVNIIEDLLFWTDNRNQPRKINVELAPGGHYTSEVQISVAKYNPYEVISLIKTVKTKVLPTPTPTATTFTVADPAGIEVGMTVLGPNVDASNYTFVKTIAGSLITIDTDPTPGSISAGDELVFLISTMTNEASNTAWPGDPDYLKSRYVRFGYRFKFEDGEYSIVSPFTQIAYIPEQKGFFVAGDEDAAYRSTVLNFMQNNAQNIELLIPLPDTYNNIGDSYKITEIDVLYKESDQTTIKVLESIVIAQNALPGDKGNTNVFTYNYQSRKPYKTLPEAQTVRVYDRVPTRALAQETAGNRIIYGNYRDVYTPPLNVSYTVGVAPKEIDYADGSSSFIEYPNHTLKENRNYQVGFILADKYGRQSSVLLSPVTSEADGAFGGSTVYSPYKSANPGMLDWLGDTLIVSVNAPITSGINGSPNFPTGEPGLYAVPTGTNQSGFSISSGTVTGNTYSFTQDGSVTNNNIPIIGNYLRGKYKDYVKVIPPITTGLTPDPTPTPPNYFVRADGPINDLYNSNSLVVPDIKYAYTINEIGWYSYKIVVKQFEQDYYNCYLPGMLNDYPEQSLPLPSSGAFPSGELDKTAHIVLLNDNINKIPRDLNEVGPDQKQYRSSVLLYGRVTNDSGTTNIQYYPGRLFDVASTIANANDLNMVYSSLGTNGKLNLYQIDTQPIIARISTSNVNNPIGVTTTTMRPVLSIYETKPVESLLDIYWETSTVGLISDLNEQALTGFEGPTGFSAFTYSQKEHQDPTGTGLVQGEENSRFVTSSFFITAPGPLDLPTAIVTSFSVTNGDNAVVTEKFSYVQAPSGEIRIRINEAFTYLKGSSIKDVFTFSFGVSLTTPEGILTNTLTTVGALENVEPSMSPVPTLFEVLQEEDFVGQLINTVNGGFTNKGAQIYFVIDSITGPDTSPTPFTINPVTGVISQTVDSARALGLYNLSVTFYDATTADGSSILGEPLSGTIDFDIEIVSDPSSERVVFINNSPQTREVLINSVLVDGQNVTLDPGYALPVQSNTSIQGTYDLPGAPGSTIEVTSNNIDSTALTLYIGGVFHSCQSTIGSAVFTGLNLTAGPTLDITLETEGNTCS